MTASTFRILVIDDDPEDISLLREIFSENSKGRSIQMDEASTIDEAVACLDRSQYDICICDYRLGTGSGLDFLDVVRERNAPFPVIVLTSQGDQKTAVEAMRRGASDYFDKHFLNPDALNRSIQNSLRWHQESRNRKQAQKQLEQAKEELEQANKSLVASNALKDQLLRMAAHDLRNPLSALMGYSEILMDEEGNLTKEELQEIVRFIHNSTKHMVALVNDLLDIAVIESGEIQLHQGPGNLQDLLEDCLKINRVFARSRSIQILEEISPVPDTRFDSHRIYQVMDNLLNNAIKFSPPGSTITVGLDTNGGSVRFRVRDQGPGIQPEDFPKLFNPFSKLKNRSSGEEHSTRLGLVISKKYVEAHGGALEVESLPGKGTTFHLCLPISQDPSS